MDDLCPWCLTPLGKLHDQEKHNLGLPPELAEFLRQEQDKLREDPGAQRTLEEVAPEQDLRLNDAARLLSVHPNTMRRMLKQGAIYGAYRVGTRGDWRVPRAGIESFKERGGQW